MCAGAIARSGLGRVVYALSGEQLDGLKPPGHRLHRPARLRPRPVRRGPHPRRGLLPLGRRRPFAYDRLRKVTFDRSSRRGNVQKDVDGGGRRARTADDGTHRVTGRRGHSPQLPHLRPRERPRPRHRLLLQPDGRHLDLPRRGGLRPRPPTWSANGSASPPGASGQSQGYCGGIFTSGVGAVGVDERPA
ncbi:hypothetical protein [Nonomuraea salmonea]|uniref:hypothetical protein n=1 Tax=Nonomuraea salmonea TaxID=46181 RepID=UPI0031E9E1E1